MVLLLGASGLLGRNVLEELLQRGVPVRALVRSPLSVPGVEVVRGSVLDDEDLAAAARGCSAIINCAGTTDMTLPSVRDFYPMNRDLPLRLCGMLDLCDIPVLIHVSTANTLVPGTREHPSDENAPFGAPYDRSAYAVSKHEGEKGILAYARQHPEKRVVVLNPGFMLGAFDSKPSSGRLMLMGYRKPLMLVTPGAKSFLHVRDAATAIVNALDRGEGRYLLCGQCMSLKDFYALQARRMHYRQLCLVVPAFLLRVVGALGTVLQKLGIRNIFFWNNTRQLLVQEWYSSNRAREELKYPRTDIGEGIEDFFRWWNVYKN